MTRTRPPWLLCAVGLLVVTGCTTEPAPAPSPSATAVPTDPEVVDPDVEALAGIVTELRSTIDGLREELEAAADGEEGALQRAAALLAADVEVVTDPSTLPAQDEATSGDDGSGAAPDDAPDDSSGAGSDDAGDDGGFSDTTGDADQDDAEPDQDGTAAPGELAPLLPGPVASRAESIQYGDLLTRTLATARSAGDDGSAVLRFLADPLAGDLGAWQRAPDGQLAAIGNAAAAGDLAATEQEILQLSGEAPRALGWVAHGLRTPADAEEAAGRALAHLAIIELALDQLA